LLVQNDTQRFIKIDWLIFAEVITSYSDIIITKLNLLFCAKTIPFEDSVEHTSFSCFSYM